MSIRPWYKRFGSDFVFGTMGLTLEQRGAYSIIIDLIHDRGQPIPDDARFMSGILGVSMRKWRSIRDVLIEAGKIYEADGFLSNERCDRDLEEAAEQARKWAESGAKGGRKRAENATNRHRTVTETQKKDNEINETGQAPLNHKRSQKPDKIEKNPPLDPPKGETKKATRLPDDWTIPDEYAEYAKGIGWSEREISDEADRFRDYWIAQGGQRGRKTNWLATWRNWLRNSNRTPHRSPTRPGRSRDTLSEALEAYQTEGDGCGLDGGGNGQARDVTPDVGSGRGQGGSGGGVVIDMQRVRSGATDFATAGIFAGFE